MIPTFITNAQTKPVVTSLVGASVGASSWILIWGEYLKLFFALVAGFFGSLGAIIAFVLVLPRVIRFIRAWRARGLIEADKE